MNLGLRRVASALKNALTDPFWIGVSIRSSQTLA